MDVAEVGGGDAVAGLRFPFGGLGGEGGWAEGAVDFALVVGWGCGGGFWGGAVEVGEVFGC